VNFLKCLLRPLLPFFLRINGVATTLKQNNKKTVKVGFVGEFGYGLVGLFPFLNFLATQGYKLNTAGLRGSSPFFYFSENHEEIPNLSVGSWGSAAGAWKMRRYGSILDPIFVPIEGSRRYLKVDNFEWASKHLSVRHPRYAHYVKLELPATPGRFASEVELLGDFFVLNIKNYQTWQGQYVPNWYLADEVEAVYQKSVELGISLVLNRSPVPPSEGEPSEDQRFVDELTKCPGVVDLENRYSSMDWSSANELQLQVLKGAKHVWATQGGNAALALTTASHVTILMRGGLDWEDYQFMANFYEAEVEILHSVFQSRFYALDSP